MLERINLVLLSSLKTYQPCTINKCHRTGSDNARV